MSTPAPYQVARTTLLAVAVERWPSLVALTAWSAVEAVPAFLSGRLVALAVDDGFLPGQLARGLGWLGLLLVASVVGAFAVRQAHLRAAAVVEPFRDQLVGRVVTGALHHAETSGGPADGSGVARLTGQVEVVRECLAGVIVMAQGFLVAVVGALTGLFSLAPALLVLVVPPLVVSVAVFLSGLPALFRHQRASVLAEEAIASRTATAVNGLRDAVACGGEGRALATIDRAVRVQAAAAEGLALASTTRTLALALGGWLPMLLILANTEWLMRDGATAGTVLGALTYVGHGLRPALSSAMHVFGNSALRLGVGMARIAETCAPAPRERVAPAAPGRGANAASELCLRRVTFAYGPRAVPVLDGLDLVVPAGDRLAVVGPSGVGKSTLAAVMAGLLSPTAGVVSLGGSRISGEYPDRLAEHRVLVPQQAYVFAGTVRENLDYLRVGASDGELDEAVAQLGADRLVRRLGGYRAELDPRRLSSGDRQLLTLVRAHLSTAPLLILDEATSQLDPDAEERAENALAAGGRTLVVIAHRVASALRADRVLVLDGTAATVGTHRSLLVNCPLYRDLLGYWEHGPRPVEPAG